MIGHPKVATACDTKRLPCSSAPNRWTASQYTLTKQGGPMSEEEATAFAALPHADDAVHLRRLEDGGGKTPDVPVPEFAEFEGAITRVHV